MGKLISDIQIMMDEALPDVERVDAQLKALVLSMEGTIPGSRAFGLSYDFVSMNPLDAANMLAIELQDKVAEYIPEIRVTEVKATPKMDGTMAVQIFAEGSDEMWP